MPILLHRSLVRLLLPVLFLPGVLLNISACSFPGVYKLDVQQGNIITQDMVNQLKPGMNKKQVRYIMGTPLLIDSFEDNRWDYFYSLKNGNDDLAQERLTLFFTDDQLVNMQGNFRPEQANSKQPAEPVAAEPVAAE